MLRWLPLALGAAMYMVYPQWLVSVENGLLDGMCRQTSGNASSDVALVEIDDATLALHGRWPWNRAQTAKLVRALNAQNPASVALAVMFPEPSPEDGELAGAIAGGRVATGYALSSLKTHPLPADLEWPAPGASGFLNVAPSDDGVLRSIPLLTARDGSAEPSLALAALRMSRPERLAALRREEDGNWRLRWNDKTARLDAHGLLRPRLRPQASFARYSAAGVLAGNVPPGALTGKIVLAGVTARGFGDERVTAMSPAYSGLAIHASVIDNLLHGGALAPAAEGRRWELLLLLAVGAGTALAPLRWVLGVLAGVIAVSFSAFVLGDVFVSPVLIALTLTGNAAMTVEFSARARESRHEKTTRELKAANDFMLAALASLTTLRDVETGAHLARVQRALRLLCDSLREKPRYRAALQPETVDLLVAVAPIHDIGKIGIPDGVLQKMGRLTPEETTLIREHVRYGRQVLEVARDQSGLRNEALFAMCQALVYSHHERWDGSGYPDGLRGEAIPLPARLLAVADVYDALATRRVYKPAIPHDEVVDEIVAGRGVLFDPDIVDAFLAQHEKFRQVYEEEHKRAAAMKA